MLKIVDIRLIPKIWGKKDEVITLIASRKLPRESFQTKAQGNGTKAKPGRPCELQTDQRLRTSGT